MPRRYEEHIVEGTTRNHEDTIRCTNTQQGIHGHEYPVDQNIKVVATLLQYPD